MNEFQIRDAMLRGAARALRMTREQLFSDRVEFEDADDANDLGRRFHLLLSGRLADVERNIHLYAMANASIVPVLVGGTVAT